MTPPRHVIQTVVRAVGSALLIAAVLASASCATGPTRANQKAARDRASALADSTEPRVYALQPGDEVNIKFFYNPELDTVTTLRPDGRFALPLIDEIDANGKTLPDLTAEIEQRYQPFLKHPEVTLNVTSFASQVVFIGGEVRLPGIIPLVPGMTVLQGVLAAGGWQSTGNARNVVIVRNQGTEEPLLLLLDLREGFDTLASYTDFSLQPKDMVFVPMTGIAKANQFIREYIRDMMPIQSSFNLQYLFSNTPFTSALTP
jgi:protein involved in polysaccharide export with SLBB domain